MPELTLSSEIEEVCRNYRVRSLHVFGSFAAGTESDSSDIDLLVEFDRAGFDGAFDQFMGFKERIEEILGRPVDLLTGARFRNRLFADEVERTKRLIYAA
jgi:uncharacterized protein